MIKQHSKMESLTKSLSLSYANVSNYYKQQNSMISSNLISFFRTYLKESESLSEVNLNS